jgi:hypothetical protein
VWRGVAGRGGWDEVVVLVVLVSVVVVVLMSRRRGWICPGRAWDGSECSRADVRLTSSRSDGRAFRNGRCRRPSIHGPLRCWGTCEWW